MTTASNANPPRHARRTAHVPRPLPVWLQVGVVLLLLWNGLQAIIHHNEPPLTANADQAAPSTTPAARFDYYYTPDRTIATGNMQPTFQYAGYYAHAPSAVNVTPVRAYDPTPGRWVDRDPLPAK